MQGDHGFSLGRHGRWSKYNVYEDGMRVPLIIAVPGTPVKASAVNVVVEALDVMPTLLDLWGVPQRLLPPATRPPLPPTPPRLPLNASASTAPPLVPLSTVRDRGYSLISSGGLVPVEGESLLPFLFGKEATVSRRRTYARIELREWLVRHRIEGPPKLPAALPRSLVGRGEMYALRTARHTYVAFLQPLCEGPCPKAALEATNGRYAALLEDGSSLCHCKRHAHVAPPLQHTAFLAPLPAPVLAVRLRVQPFVASSPLVASSPFVAPLRPRTLPPPHLITHLSTRPRLGRLMHATRIYFAGPRLSESTGYSTSSSSIM